MAFKLGERVRETSTTTGTTDFTLAGAVTGFRTFGAILSNGDTTWYMAVLGTEWEMGVGTFNSGVLQRTTVLASSAGGTTKVTFSAGEKAIFCTPPASMLAKLVDVAAVIDEDDMASDSPTRPPSQQSVKAFVEANAGAPDVQGFDSSEDWIMPANATIVMVELFGGGGGGGSGRKNAAGANRYSGGGGGGGGYTRRYYLASELTSTVAVTIGAGGTGAPSQTTANTNGTAGANGGDTTFGSYATAYGGQGGGGGTNSAGGSGGTGGGAAASSATDPTSDPGNGSTGTAGANTTNGENSRNGGAGGGGGSGSGTTDLGFTSGSGGREWAVNTTGGGVSGVTGAVGNNGANWGDGGSGGSLAAGSGNVTGNNGGNGGRTGGGGGGSASTGTGNSGAGGNGGNGFARITTW